MDRGGTWSLDENKPRVDFRFPPANAQFPSDLRSIKWIFPSLFFGITKLGIDLVYMTCYRAIKDVKQKEWIRKEIFGLVTTEMYAFIEGMYVC